MGKTSEGVTLGKLITDSQFKKILNSVMPGRTQFHKSGSKCKVTCPAYNNGKCRCGPDENLCTKNWSKSQATLLNFQVLNHVLENFDHYNGGDLKDYTADNPTVIKVNKLIREHLMLAIDNQFPLTESGKRRIVKHIKTERNPQVSDTFKHWFKENHNNKVFCEICGTNLEDVYGEIGKDYAECHHVTPVATLKKRTNVDPDKLKMLCPNCHRMIHRLIAQEGLPGKKAFKDLKKRWQRLNERDYD